MAQAEMLQVLATQVREKTIRLLEVAADGELKWTPPGTSNHILWHAGHAIWLADVFSIEPLVGRSMLPEPWAGSFGAKCRPVSQTPTWPARAQILSTLRAQLGVITRELGKRRDEDLDLAVSDSGNMTVAERMVHGFHDEANHQGEMYLLMKLFRAQAAQ